jgi:hypothetical protein
MDYEHRQPDREAGSKTDEGARPEHTTLLGRTGWSMLHCGGDIASRSIA